MFVSLFRASQRTSWSIYGTIPKGENSSSHRASGINPRSSSWIQGGGRRCPRFSRLSHRVCWRYYHHIHKLHGFEGYIIRIFARRCQKSPGVLCRPMPKAEGFITFQIFPVIKWQIFWYCRSRRHVNQNQLKNIYLFDKCILLHAVVKHLQILQVRFYVECPPVLSIKMLTFQIKQFKNKIQWNLTIFYNNITVTFIHKIKKNPQKV